MFETNPIIQHFPYLGLFFLLILGTLGLPFLEDGILMLSGFLASHHVIHPLPTFSVVYFGLLITDFSLYLVGKNYGRRLVEHKRFKKIISPGRLTKLEEKFKKWGILVILLGRHLLGLRAQIFLAAGVMKMSWKKFLIADAISALFTIAVMGGIGYVGGNSTQSLRKNIKTIEHTVIAIIAIWMASTILYKYLKNRRKGILGSRLQEI